MPDSPSSSDTEFERLVIEALRTQPTSPPVEDSLIERLRIMEEFLSDPAGAPAEPALLYRDELASLRMLPLVGGVTVGRDSACELSFPQHRVFSRRHFSIGQEQGFFVLRDHESRNGTFINGETARVVEHVLRDGDLISAGGRLFVFTRGGGGPVSSDAELPGD